MPNQGKHKNADRRGTYVRDAEKMETTRLGYQLGWLHSLQGERSLSIAWIAQCCKVPFIKTENTEGGQGRKGVEFYSGHRRGP